MFKPLNHRGQWPKHTPPLPGENARRLLLLTLGFLGGFWEATPVFGFQAPKISSQVKQAVKEANRLENFGHFEEAMKSYGQAKEEAKTELDRAEIALEAGLAKFRKAQAMESADVLKQAEQDFKRVTQMQAAPQQTNRAWNNLVPVYLAMDKPDLAKQALEECSVDSFPKDKRFLYYYNSARVYAALGQPVKAVAEYKKSFIENPQFLQARAEAWDLVNAKANADRDLSWEGYRFGLKMIEAGQATKARELAIESVQKMRRPEHVEAMLSLVVRSLAFSSFDEKTLKKELEKLKSGELFPAPSLEEIQVALSKPFSLDDVLSPDYRPDQDFPWWLSSERNGQLDHDFSLLLGNIGDFQVGIGLHAGERALEPKTAEAALTRYLLAWDIAPGNFLAAQNAAWVLATSHDQLKDSDQALDRLDGLTSRLLGAKGGFYSRPNKKQEDWERILRMHMLLGTIYEAKEIWGSEETTESAIFQWTRALEVEQKVRQMAKNPEYRSSGLHQRLAYAYQETAAKDQAFMHYLEAAAAFLQQRDTESAEKAIEDAQKLDLDLTDAQKQQLQKVLDELNQAKSQ